MVQMWCKCRWLAAVLRETHRVTLCYPDDQMKQSSRAEQSIDRFPGVWKCFRLGWSFLGF